MKKTVWWFGVLGLMLMVTWMAQAQKGGGVSLNGLEPGSDFVPNEILVMVNPGGPTSARLQGTSPQDWINQIDQGGTYLGLPIKIVNRYDLATEFRRQGLQVLTQPRVCGGTLLTLQLAGADTALALENAIRSVEAASDILARNFGYQSSEDFLVVVPNDGYTKPDAMMQATDEADPVDLTGFGQLATRIKVAVLDSGFSSDLGASTGSGPSRTSAQEGIDTTATPPNFSSWNRDDFRRSYPGDVEVNGHGTPVARVIRSIAVNSKPILIKVSDSTGKATGKNVAIGLCYAAYQRAQVVNLSVGGFYDSKLVRGAVRDVLAQGAVIVAGAGNSRNLLWHRSPDEIRRDALRPEVDSSRGWNQSVYPAAWSSGSAGGNADGIISVGSINSKKNVSRFSTMNKSVDLLTYGEKIQVSFGYGFGNSFRFISNELRSGTSFAAPIITGIVAVLRYQHPTWTASEIENAIVRTGMRQEYDCYLDPPAGTPADPDPRNKCVDATATTTEDRKVSVFRHNIDAIRSLLGR
jgi:subtilisin family serine protease